MPFGLSPSIGWIVSPDNRPTHDLFAQPKHNRRSLHPPRGIKPDSGRVRGERLIVPARRRMVIPPSSLPASVGPRCPELLLTGVPHRRIKPAWGETRPDDPVPGFSPHPVSERIRGLRPVALRGE